MATQPVDSKDVKLQPSLPPDTTHQEDVTHAGQRKINLIWERTQSAIAIMVTSVVLIVCGWMVINGKTSEAAFLLLSNVFFLIVGVYFQRTNHTRVGGVGEKTGDSR